MDTPKTHSCHRTARGARPGGTVAALFVVGAMGCVPATQTRRSTEEASGVVRLGGEFLFVVDEDAGAYYSVPVPPPGSTLSLEPGRVHRTAWPEARLAIDLEAVDVLADGRVVVLSERLRALVGSGGIVAEYDDHLGALGKRGLEGLAVRRLPSGASVVAVLWEGGYLSRKNLPPQLERHLGNTALRPLVVEHRIGPGESALKVKITNAPSGRRDGAPTLRELAVPEPPGREPTAQRFRAPDLVWQRTENGEWGYLVLLSSHNAPLVGRPARAVRLELRQFSREGRDLGVYLNLKELLPQALAGFNWEGLCWAQEGHSVALVHDTPPEGRTPTLCVLELPPLAEWDRD